MACAEPLEAHDMQQKHADTQASLACTMRFVRTWCVTFEEPSLICFETPGRLDDTTSWLDIKVLIDDMSSAHSH